MALIGDRVTYVTKMLGNRTDLASRISGWLVSAYIELGMGYDFEDLEDTVDDAFASGGDGVYNYPTNARAVKAITLYDIDSGAPIFLRKKNIVLIDRQPAKEGVPSIYAVFKKQVVVRLIPNKTYIVKWRVWMKPVIESTINSTELKLPDDWLEILDYSAALRGHVELHEADKAAQLHQLLFGANTQSGRLIPGLIKQRLLMRQAESPSEEYGIRPKVRRYNQ